MFSGLQNFAAAATVFGQASFTVGEPNEGSLGPGPASLFDPAGVAASGDGKVFIADAANRRVLVLPQVPEALFSEAAFALGQPDVFSGGLTGEPDGFRTPRSVSIGAGKMAVADTGAHRVVIYESIPVDGSARPTVVVGQPDFDTQVGDECDEFSLDSPDAAYITPGGKLIVADAGNSRVLVWNSVPTAQEPGRRADVVLGQADFIHCAANAGSQGPARHTMRNPSGVWSDGIRLAVADTVNNRVLLWDDIRDLRNGQEPDRVLGQPDFESAVLTAPDRHTLAFPRAVASNGTHLAVSDGNNRVLLWNAWPSQPHGQPADVVLGQRDFLQGANDDSVESAQTLEIPYGLTFHQDKLLVIDEGNHRLLIFKSD